MVRAVKGMVAEKEMIFSVFLFSILTFQVMTLSSTWVVMKTYASYICSSILVIGGLFWYIYCLRIYNRFRFIEPDLDWKDDQTINNNNEKYSKDEERNRYQSLPLPTPPPPREKKYYGEKKVIFKFSR
jgi:hypothetical protein